MHSRILITCSILLISALVMTGCERKRSSVLLEDGDMVVKRDSTSYEILRIETQDGRAEGVSIYKAAILPEDLYKCDNDPPKDGDTCKCVGTGLDLIFDCAWLELDCKEGNFDKEAGSCSDWDGDPLPEFP